MIDPRFDFCTQHHDQDLPEPSTINVEFDRALLERLRQRDPEKSDGELHDSMVTMTLGRESLRRVQARISPTESEAIALGVEAVHEARP